MTTGFSLGLIVLLISISFLNLRAKAVPNAKHGLTGQYYVSQLPGESPTEHRFYFTQIWTNKDDFQLPQPLTEPAAVRVDTQIAFGQGKGFANSTAVEHRAAWAPADYPNPPGWTGGKPWDYFAAAIWRGYIHLPKAGTYYFATVSSGPSAVYLNQSRVALNGPGSGYGGLLTSDKFAYDHADVQDFIQNVRGSPFAKRLQDAYAIPVTIEGPRDLPIEVRYNAWRTPSGIDLLWVTPDTPRDTSGKPLAKLVPSDALYTEAPGPIEKPAVRSANSTISADLYCSALEETKPLTLSIRLADKEGRPVAGKRVVFVTLADDNFGYDDTFQPDKPSDENGIATAQVRATSGARGHDSSIYATDVTDLVGVGQVAHVRFPHVENAFFASPCSDGYDPNVITVEPLPMLVGRPVTLRVRLENRQKSEAELSATFQANDWNIGASTWNDIGKVENIHLKPGESKQASVTWTPKAAEGHQCFRVQLIGSVKSASAKTSVTSLFAHALPPLAIFQNTPLGDEVKRIVGGKQPLGTAQRNVGPVTGCDPKIMILYTLSGHGIAKFCFGPSEPPPDTTRNPTKTAPLGQPPSSPPQSASNALPSGNAPPASTPSPPTPNGTPPSDTSSGSGQPPPPSQSPKAAGTIVAKTAATKYASLCDQDLAHLQAETKSDNTSSPGHWLTLYHECQKERFAWVNLSQDPPSQSYRHLAIAQSDNPVGYIDAARSSMDRYRGAQADGDLDGASRHLKAMQLYFNRIAEAERRAADEEQKRTEQTPADDDRGLAQAQTELNTLIARLHSRGVTQDDLSTLKAHGVSSEEAKQFYSDLLSSSEPLPLKGARATLLEASALRRQIADEAAKVEGLLPDEGIAGEAFMQVYNVSNPHDKQETVDLFIRPLSISPAWKASIANIAEGQVVTQSGKAGENRPRFPVQENEAGIHYSVTLPAKTQIPVASVLIPAGEIGANTIARWAVEGKIGGESIGTMVHEMNVPYIVTDLQLPPVGSKEEVDQPTEKTAHKLSSLEITIIAAGVVIVVIVAFIFLRRRREAPAA